jgi:hypothetical protein
LSARANAVDKMKGIEQVIKNENITELHAYILHRGSPSSLSPNPAVKGKRIQSQRWVVRVHDRGSWPHYYVWSKGILFTTHAYRVGTYMVIWWFPWVADTTWFPNSENL